MTQNENNCLIKGCLYDPLTRDSMKCDVFSAIEIRVSALNKR